MNKIMLILIGAVGLLVTALFFVFNSLYLPERDLRKKKEYEIVIMEKQHIAEINGYVKKIERFNENEKNYTKRIRDFENKTKELEDYRGWADGVVHPAMLDLLQGK